MILMSAYICCAGLFVCPESLIPFNIKDKKGRDSWGEKERDIQTRNRVLRFNTQRK